jgi:hypothetical protein
MQKVSKKRMLDRILIVLDVLFPRVLKKVAYSIRGPQKEDTIVLDVFIPSVNVAFRAVPLSGRGSASSPEKIIDYCKNTGVGLVQVHPGWDLMPDSLRQMILEVKPDAFDSVPDAVSISAPTPASTTPLTN